MSTCTGEILLTRDDRKVMRCTTCQYVHVYPLYSVAELESFYKERFSESTPSPNWAEKVWNIQRFKASGRILDIGCWEGRQLEEFLGVDGWECAGTELNTRAAEVARRKGITVHNVSLREFFEAFRGQTWDVINLAYILEHIPDPRNVLQRLREFLAPDGILIVEVPNEFSPMQLAYLKAKNLEPYWIALPVHLNYFDRASLEALAENSGYDIVHREGTFPMEVFLLMGDDYLGNPELGKVLFQKVVTMEAILRDYAPDLVSRIYTSLYQASIGRALVLYLQPRR